MKNDYHIGNVKISIPPTLLFSTMGKIEDARKAVTLDAKHPGDLVYILGETYHELGGSEWYAMHGFVGNQVPKVNAEKAKALYNALSRAMNAGLVASCHDCSDGGAGVAIAETAFAGGLGMLIHLALFPSSGIDRNDTLLFSESQSRFVVTISPAAKKSFEAIMKGIAMGQVGEVLAEGLLKIDGLDGKRIIEEDINELKAVWQRPLNF
jgi:phosphoribosylformylglycinamidine synthase